jgi:DNA-3-methyladenine glycosylase
MKNYKYVPLSQKFYLRDTLTVAKDLLGKVIVRKIGSEFLTGMIVETEAYIGEFDPACHAYNRLTDRTRIMYEEGGKAYVYFIYGNYFCFNVVSERKGSANAVLIRAVEPVEGIETMKALRGSIKNFHELTNGPAKLCMAFDIGREFYGEDLTRSNRLFIAKGRRNNFNVGISKRIGLNVGAHFPFRFFIKDNQFVTRHKFNKDVIEVKG